MNNEYTMNVEQVVSKASLWLRHVLLSQLSEAGGLILRVLAPHSSLCSHRLTTLPTHFSTSGERKNMATALCLS